MTHLRCLSILAFLVLAGVPTLSGQVTSNHLKGFQWRPLGPTATGGRIVDIAVHPKDSSTIYAASASGGLWKTDNKGTTWSCVFEKEGTISIGDIAIDPNNPETLWLGSGEANNQRSSMWGDGVYKSSDGGKTWQNLGLRETHHIGRIVIDPTDSKVVYVAALGHLYTSNEERGLYKTADGGKTWKRVLYISPQVGVVDVVMNPQDSKVLYAATYERLRKAWNFDGAGPGSAIYKSSDGGASWQKMNGGLPSGELGRIGLAIYDKNPSILYATVSNQNYQPLAQNQKVAPTAATFGLGVQFKDGKCLVASVTRRSIASNRGVTVGDQILSVAGAPVANKAALDVALGQIKPRDAVSVRLARKDKNLTVSFTIPAPARRQIGGEIYRTDDAGVTWVKQNRQPVGGTPAYYYGQIRIDPQDDKRVYVLSVPVYVTSDGGKTWSSAGARSVHVDHHALWIDPSNPKQLYLGNDGGFHISYDRGKTWDHIYNLPLSQFYAIGVDMQRPYHVYGGLQDNGSFGGPSRSRSPSGIGRFDWHKIGGGDGFYVQVHKKKPNLVISESQFGAISRQDRKTGVRKSIRPGGGRPTAGRPRDRFNWSSPILISQHSDETVYFGGSRLYKSANLGDDWKEISGDLTTADKNRIAGNVPHCTITTIAESPLNAEVLLVGTDDGNVQWTNDGGKNWIDMSQRMPIRPSGWWCSRVELSHHDIKTAYVSFTGYREDDFRAFVFVTNDGGESWQSIGHSLPEGPINVVKEDPKNRNLLYVGSDFAVHVSFDRGGSWLPLGTDLPRVPVHDLLIHHRDRDIVIGTHGRGIYVMDANPLQQLAAVARHKESRLLAVENAVQWRFQSTQSISGNRRVLTPNPPYGAVIYYSLKKGADKATLTVVDKDKKVVAQLPLKKEVGLHRVVWNLRRARGVRGGPGGRGGRGGRSGRGRSSVVPVGKYTAVLKIGDKEQRQSFQVEADPLGKPTQ